MKVEADSYLFFGFPGGGEVMYQVTPSKGGWIFEIVNRIEIADLAELTLGQVKLTGNDGVDRVSMKPGYGYFFRKFCFPAGSSGMSFDITDPDPAKTIPLEVKNGRFTVAVKPSENRQIAIE